MYNWATKNRAKYCKNKLLLVLGHVTTNSTNMAAAGDSYSSSVRKRRFDSSKAETKATDSSEGHITDANTDTEKEKTLQSVQTGTYWLTRIVLLRSVAFIYRKHVDTYCRGFHSIDQLISIVILIISIIRVFLISVLHS